MASRPNFYIDVSHSGLNKFRRVSGRDAFVVEQMAKQQAERWNAEWVKQQESLRERQHQKAQKNLVLSQEENARILTLEALKQIAAAQNILADSLSVDDKIEWSSLKDSTRFSKKRPERPETAWSRGSGTLRPKPAEPKISDPAFQPKITFLDRIFPSKRQKKIDAALTTFRDAHAKWRKNCEDLDYADALDAKAHEDIMANWKSELDNWEQEKSLFEERQRKHNAAIDSQEAAYKAGDPESIRDYCQLVLHKSKLPSFMPKNFEIDYDEISKILLVEIQLPGIRDIPCATEYRYVKRTGEISEKSLSQARLSELYDSVVYQQILRTLHELFEADAINKLDAITLNGWVDHLDRASGNKSVSFITSIQVKKNNFENINLSLVDPKECFRALKGISASRLSNITPIAPIATLNKDDKRFVDSKTVEMNEGANLASIPWDEFEHLVRQLFEKEFSAFGGEVRVTQASRDGGVDAVIFDPDPIRGGKMIVQAKRYTNVVSVSAVRDLYGTVQHEGATKGILVTTSAFGPDAYDFAKDKPLTLLDGGRLLYLLNKHGYNARIDLQEAKRLQSSGV